MCLGEGGGTREGGRVPVDSSDNSPPVTHENQSADSCWWRCPDIPHEGSACVEMLAPIRSVDRNVAIRSWDDCVVARP